MIRPRISVCFVLALAAACSPKAPAPLQCTSDADCKGLVCNAGGTCVVGAAIDKDQSTIDVSQTKALADGTDVVAITVTLRDAGGNALISRGVQLSVDGTGNTLTQPTLSTNAVGQVTGTLTSIKAEIKNVSAIAGIVIGQPTTNAVALSKKAQVEFDADSSHLQPPGPGDSDTKIAITAADGTSAPDVVADGSTPVKIHLVLRDVHGNPVPDAQVFFTVNGSDITTVPANGAGTTDSNGIFDATITSHTVQVATVHFVVGSIEQTTTITFSPGPADATKTTFTIATGATAPGTACGQNTQPACVIQAEVASDVSFSPVYINIHAKDQFDNDAVGAKVWFSWPQTSGTDCSVPPDTSMPPCEQGNTFQFPASHVAKLEGGTQPDPLLAEVGGTFADPIIFFSNHAEVKQITLHVDELSIPLPAISVIAGPPAATLSQFAVFGTIDGSPVIADTDPVTGHFYFLVAYVADSFNNPAPNVVVNFASSGAGDVIRQTDQMRRCVDTTAPGAQYICTNWDGLATYNTGDLAIDPDDGNVYALIAGGDSSVQPSTSVGTNWSLVGPVGPVVTDATGTVQYQLSADTVVVDGAAAGVRAVRATTPELTDTGALWSGDDCAATPAYPCTPTLQAAFGPGNPSQFLADGSTPAATLALSSSTVTTDPGNPVPVVNVNFVTITINLKDKNGNDTPQQGLTLDAFNVSGGAECATCTFTEPANTAGTYTANIASAQAQALTVKAAVNGDFASATPDFILSAPLTFTPGAIDPNNSQFVSTTSGTPTADGATPATFTLTLKDAESNVISGKTPQIAVAPGTGVSTPFTAASTDSNGVSLISFVSTKAEAKTAQASIPSDSVIVGQTPGVTFVHGVAATSGTGNATTFTASPATISTDSSSSGSVLTLTVTDANGNPVPSFSVTFSDSPVHGSFTPSTTLSTDANGVVQVTYKSTVAASEVITATGSGFSKASPSIAVQAGSVDPGHSHLFVCPTGQGACTSGVSITSTAGIAVEFTANVADSNGNAIVTSGGVIGVSCAGTASASPASATSSGSTSSYSGSINSTKTGSFFCTASYTPPSGSATPFATAGVTFNPGGANNAASDQVLTVAPPSALADNNTGVITIAMVVRDGNSNPVGVGGATAVFSSDHSSSPGDTFTCTNGTAPNCTTDASGVVSAQVRSKLARVDGGAPSIHVNIPTLAQRNAAVTFTPGAANKLDFAPGYLPPTSIGAGVVMAQPNTANPIAVRILDQFNNQTSVPSPISISLGLALAQGATTPNTVGSLGGVTTVATTNVATFSTVAINGTALGSCDQTFGPCRTIVATSNGLGSATSAIVHVVPANGSNCTAAGGTCSTLANTDGQHNWTPPSNMVVPAATYNFNTITIPAGVTITTNGQGVLELHASGDVTINGIINVTGGNGGAAGGQGNNGGGFGGASGTSSALSTANNPNIPSSGAGGNPWSGNAIWPLTGTVGYAYGGGPVTGLVPAWGFAYGNNGAGTLPGLGGGPLGGGGGGGTAQIDDRDSGGGAGGGGRAGGAGGFTGADGCVQAGGAGGGPNGAPATGCGQSALGGANSPANGCTSGGYAGGNGGIGSSSCTPIAGSGGGGSIGCDAAGDLAMVSTLRPGSGGGGGGNGGDVNYEARSGGGGGGGGGGGALRIVSNTRIVLGSAARILANGGNGGNGATSLDDCDDDSGGGGGGGSGGAIYLQAPVLNAPSGSAIQAFGGTGGNSGGVVTAGPGGVGGPGRIRLSVDASLSPAVGGQVTVLTTGASALVSGLSPTPAPGTAQKAYVAQYPQ